MWHLTSVKFIQAEWLVHLSTSISYLFVPVMLSATPCGILLHSIVIHASCSRFLACVNREWLQAVRAVICELRRGFLGSSFHVKCLGHDIHEDTAKQRLCRSLERNILAIKVKDFTWAPITHLQKHMQNLICNILQLLLCLLTMIVFLCVSFIDLYSVLTMPWRDREHGHVRELMFRRFPPFVCIARCKPVAIWV